MGSLVCVNLRVDSTVSQTYVPGYGRGGQTRCTSKTKGPREKLSTQKLFVGKSWMRKSALGFGLGPSVQPETGPESRTVGPYKMEEN